MVQSRETVCSPVNTGMNTISYLSLLVAQSKFLTMDHVQQMGQENAQLVALDFHHQSGNLFTPVYGICFGQSLEVLGQRL